MVFPDGSMQEGNFVNGVPSGHGKFTAPGAEMTYEGNHSEDGNRDGEGEMKFNDGRSYKGTFERGNPHGEGKLIAANGDVYEGHFVNGRQEGRGKHTQTCGRVVEGDWMNSLPNGQVKETTSEGQTFEGTYENGKRSQGKIVFPSGRSYVGGFVNNAPSG